MYIGLLYFHSFLRYAVLALLFAAIIQGFAGWFGKKPFSKAKKIYLLTVISTHIQFATGLILYFFSPFVKFSDFGGVMRDKEARFWTVEHIGMMLVAVILITLGSAWSKKDRPDRAKHKRIAVFFTIALIIVLLAIPWPFGSVPRPWF